MHSQLCLLVLVSIPQLSSAYTIPAPAPASAWKQVQATRHLIQKNKADIVTTIEKQRSSPAQYDSLEKKFIELIRLDDELNALLSRLVVSAVRKKFSMSSKPPLPLQVRHKSPTAQHARAVSTLGSIHSS